MAKKNKDVELALDEETAKNVKPKKERKIPKTKKEKAPKDKGGKVSRGITNPVRNLIVTAAVSVLLGVAFFVKPYEVSIYSGYGAGGILAAVGIVYILIYFLRKPVSGVYRSEFAVGLVALLAGAYVILSGVITSTGGVGYIMIIRVIGILIVADGILKVQYAVDIGRMKFKAWWVALIFAVLGIAVGVLTATDFSGKAITSSQTAPLSMLYPMGYTIGLGAGYGNYAAFYGGMKILGIAFMANGLFDIGTLIVLAIRNHKAARAEAIEEASAMIAEAKMEAVALPEEEPEADEEVVVTAEPAPELVPDSMPEPVYVPGDPSLEAPALATPMDE